MVCCSIRRILSQHLTYVVHGSGLDENTLNVYHDDVTIRQIRGTTLSYIVPPPRRRQKSSRATVIHPHRTWLPCYRPENHLPLINPSRNVI